MNSNSNVRVISSDENWLEGTAVSQLRGTAGLPGVELAVGLPDLHPGKSGPVGAAFVTRGVLYPHLIGNDIGCGMGLWQAELSRKKVKLDRWEHKLTDLDRPWPGDRTAWLDGFGVAPGEHDNALGTIGGGNHFAELQQVNEVVDAGQFKALGLDEQRLVVLVHSGSRGLGREVLQAFQTEHGYEGVADDAAAACAYMQRHDHAVKWAAASRALIAGRFLNALSSDAQRVLDLPHNFVARETGGSGGAGTWIHRKGANPSTRGALVIPGSRGALSYLVIPKGDQAANAYSLSHGAGRKWNRTDCRARLRERYGEADLRRTGFGGRVICEDRDLLYEEAPQAYKNVAAVVGALVAAGLVDVVASFTPLLTYKVRRTLR